jgi:AraC-like DNA-binding protein
MQENSKELRIHEDDIPSFSIKYKTDNHTATLFHSHSGYEIVWLKKGEARYIFKDKVYHLTKGHVLFFESSEFHKISLSEDSVYERVVIMFTDDFLPFDHPIIYGFKQFLKELPMPHYVIHLFTWKVDQFQIITDHLLREQEEINLWEQESARQVYLLQLLLFIGREVQSSYDSKSHLLSLRQSDNMSFNERILKEINLVWDTEWRLDFLAERLHFSKYYLCHFFKKEFGVTIHQYIMQRRIYEAKKMLINSDISIHELAVKVGFSTASNFIRSFKKYVQTTPKQFREKYSVQSLEF